MPVVSKGEFTVSRLDDGVSSYLHTAWKMADGTFTTVYPQENLILGSSDFSTGVMGSNTVKLTGEDGYNGHTVLKTTVSASLVGGYIDAWAYRAYGATKTGKYTLKFKAKASISGASLTSFFYGPNTTTNQVNSQGQSGTSSDGRSAFNLTTEWQDVWVTWTQGETTSAKSMILGRCSKGTQDIDFYMTEPKLVEGESATIYTPAPSEDYAAAYPKWRGEYTDFTAADSTNPDDYTWTAYLGQSGQDGNNGADGVGIANTKIDYQLHTSATTPPTGTWVTSPPAVTVGKYLWTRTILEYTDGTKSTPAYSVSGGPGDTGPQGPPTGIVAQDTVPDAPYVGMLWQNTGDIAGYINPATYRWNGSAWEIYQFTAQNILAETFTGFTFQGVKMIASEFISHQEFDRVIQPAPESIIENHVTDISIADGRLLIETNVDTIHDLSAGVKWTDQVHMETTVDDTLGFIIDGTRRWGQDGTTTYSALVQNSEFIALLPNSRDAMSEKDMVTNNNWRNVVATKHCGRQLWDGGQYMTSNQVVTPMAKLSDCLNGWLLQWQRYNPGTGLDNSRYFYQPITKAHPSGRGITLYISAPASATNNGGVPAATKYIYVTDTTITGYDANSVSPGNNWALSGVFGW